MAEEKKERRMAGKIVAVVIIAVVVVAVVMFLRKDKSLVSSVVDSTKYQAVFVTNGQVYFGKVSGETKQYVSLSDVYYLVLKQPLQNQKEGEEQTQEQPKPGYSLIKLGKEMHGPTSMSINRDQILFIENLADDSKVVSAMSSQK
ncbi:MAG TPA: hypothetical protein DCS28_04305 [Candidatus Moranbacteria bacterium]|nr:hypothetical protein [Candidatus Moranbacteria bacterium]HAT75232.1 hypothetical protein [Candidatus Moranbacteria bacterium]